MQNLLYCLLRWSQVIEAFWSFYLLLCYNQLNSALIQSEHVEIVKKNLL